MSLEPALALLSVDRWWRSAANGRRPQFDGNPRSIILMGRWWRRSETIALMRIAIPSHCLLLTVSRLAITRGTLSVLFQDGALELRGSTKAIEAISFAEVGLDNLGRGLNTIDGTILAAGIG